MSVPGLQDAICESGTDIFFLSAFASLLSSVCLCRVILPFGFPFVISRATRGVCLLITVQKGG